MDSKVLTQILNQVNLGRMIEKHCTAAPVIIPASKIRIFRPSSLYNFCPVEAAYAIKMLSSKTAQTAHQFVQTQQLPARLTAIVDTGTVIHHQLQYYAGLLGLAVGQWRCPACGAKTGDGKMPVVAKRNPLSFDMSSNYPARCPKCKGENLSDFPAWRYVEARVQEHTPGVLQQFQTSGSTDQIWRVPLSPNLFKKLIVDYKTINNAGFTLKYGTLPKPEHVEQLQDYLGLAQQDAAFIKRFGKIDLGLLVYYAKDSSEFKLFLVEYNPKVWRASLAKISWARAGNLKNKADYRTCKDVKDPDARSCLFCKVCWGMTAPPNFMA